MGAPDDAQAGCWTPANADAAARELAFLARLARSMRGDRPPPDVTGRTVVLVYDQLRHALHVRAAVAHLRHLRAAEVVVAAPVATHSAFITASRWADATACAVLMPDAADAAEARSAQRPFLHDRPVRFTEVRRLLAAAEAHSSPALIATPA